MTQHGSWMVIYPLFKWSRGIQGEKTALASGQPPESNHLQPVRTFARMETLVFGQQDFNGFISLARCVWLEDKIPGLMAKAIRNSQSTLK